MPFKQNYFHSFQPLFPLHHTIGSPYNTLYWKYIFPKKPPPPSPTTDLVNPRSCMDVTNTQTHTFTTNRKWRKGSIGGWEYSCCNTSLLSVYEKYCITNAQIWMYLGIENKKHLRGSTQAKIHHLAILTVALSMMAKGSIVALILPPLCVLCKCTPTQSPIHTDTPTHMLVFFALGNAKVLSFALGNAKLPDASSFAS